MLYQFEKSESMQLDNHKILLGEIEKHSYSCLKDKLEENFWDSEDIDDVKDLIEILCGIKKITFYDIKENK